jgi:hypothetical protein
MSLTINGHSHAAMVGRGPPTCPTVVGLARHAARCMSIPCSPSLIGRFVSLPPPNLQSTTANDAIRSAASWFRPPPKSQSMLTAAPPRSPLASTSLAPPNPEYFRGNLQFRAQLQLSRARWLSIGDLPAPQKARRLQASLRTVRLLRTRSGYAS